MPFIAAPVVAPPPAPVVPVLTPFDIGSAFTVTLSRGDDSIILLRSHGAAVGKGSSGWDMPDVRFTPRLPGSWDGGFAENISYGAREIFIPLILKGDQNFLADLTNRIARLVNPVRGEVTITIAHRNGKRRRINGVYIDGLQGPLAPLDGRMWRRPALKFWCGDPYFQDVDAISTRFAYGESPGTLLGDPFLPLKIGNSQTLGNVNAINAGDATAYPVWTIHGPADDATITNTTTGQAWAMGEIGPTETITADLRRGVQTVKNHTGANALSRLDAGADLWALEPGNNAVDLALTGSTEATSVTLTYTPRFLTAW